MKIVSLTQHFVWCFINPDSKSWNLFHKFVFRNEMKIFWFLFWTEMIKKYIYSSSIMSCLDYFEHINLKTQSKNIILWTYFTDVRKYKTQFPLCSARTCVQSLPLLLYTFSRWKKKLDNFVVVMNWTVIISCRMNPTSIRRLLRSVYWFHYCIYFSLQHWKWRA